MTKREENRELEAKKKDWDGKVRPINKFIKEIKKIVIDEKNKMMYGKRETDKIDRFAYEFSWWFKLVIIFCAFSYVAGR